VQRRLKSLCVFCITLFVKFPPWGREKFQRPRIARIMAKFSVCRSLLGTIFTQYLEIPLYECFSNICLSYEKVLL
jgi:hypothetical protein